LDLSSMSLREIQAAGGASLFRGLAPGERVGNAGRNILRSDGIKLVDFGIIKNTGELVVNVPFRRQARAVDWCGMVSGRDVDKWEGAALSQAPALKVQCPIIRECPIHIECQVRETLNLGSHVMFVSEVAAVQISSSLIDAKGRFRLEKAGLLAYGLGQYFELGAVIGRFGFSVQKRKHKSRR
ncbi:MAG: flavin reductase family protein, partial [Desulfobacteraceae bacterium]|nr:flavin reductase family protein [Desulfobacteraceae bacterium]